jgi:hypothetical protein
VSREDELRAIVRATPWLVEILVLVRELDLPDCYVGAGAVRDVVFDERFGSGFDPNNVKDVDVVYFDADDLSAETENSAELRLQTVRPDLKWDVKNEARVHLWYEERFGVPFPPIASIAEAAATWPETATAVAVRLNDDDDVEVLAPLGLDDLMNGIWRWNPTQVPEALYRERLAKKRPQHRWPAITVAP